MSDTGITATILKRLKTGPATNRELQDAACTHGGDVARTMSKLAERGMAMRVDGGSGRGSRAVYALTEPTRT